MSEFAQFYLFNILNWIGHASSNSKVHIYNNNKKKLLAMPRKQELFLICNIYTKINLTFLYITESDRKHKIPKCQVLLHRGVGL